MTNQQLKELEDKLWDSANSLRAYGGIKASDYAVPVLGLIFLRFAENKYSHYEPEILAEFEQHKGTRMQEEIDKIAVAKCGFYLPEHARYDYLLTLSGDQSMAKALKQAMESIEKYQGHQFQGVLPKDAYFDIEKKKKDILPDLLKAFSDIPKDASGDVFGKIYEYFLGKFALSEGQKGGEFFTPTSVVRFIVEVIEPFKGRIYDPACGSGGMFVQSAKFVEQASGDISKDIYVCGQEFMGETVRLAKMNLLVNNLRGEIAEVNSYENNPHQSYGKFDYVMANPPFNVKSVKESTVKEDQRFYQYGLPKGKGKKEDKISDANYLWISLFATSLNEKGRAGFVMANSASDARHAEYDIRKKIVDSGIVDCMVTMPSNMFFTVTLPATLWFFDKGKMHTDRKDKILFLDARNVYRQIDRAHREWTEEQVQNLSAIVRLYRGENERYLDLIAHYIQQGQEALPAVPKKLLTWQELMGTTLANLDTYYRLKHLKVSSANMKKLEAARWQTRLRQLKDAQMPELPDTNKIADFDAAHKDNEQQKNFSQQLAEVMEAYNKISEQMKERQEALLKLWEEADMHLKLKGDKEWNELFLNKSQKDLAEGQQQYLAAQDAAAYWHTQLDWLQSRFPEAYYADITGLCKAADRAEYVEEQDYSLNPGRYVGVEIEDDRISATQFLEKFKSLKNQLGMLNNKAHILEDKIEINSKVLVND